VRPAVFISAPLLAVAGAACAATAALCAAEPLDYNRDIRPILSEKCFKCHGPDAAAREGKLRLDVRADALAERRSGSIPIVPGKPDLSEVVQRIESRFADERMPTADFNVTPAAAEITTLRRPAHRSHGADKAFDSVTAVRTSGRSVKKDFLQNSVIAAGQPECPNHRRL
jgi:hypothetical protein